MRDAPAGPDFLAATAADIDALLRLINGLLALARVDAVTPDMFTPRPRRRGARGDGALRARAGSGGPQLRG